MSYDQLENRQLLAVSAAFSSGTLTVSLSAANDAAFLQVDNGGKIDVGTTIGSSNVYNGTDIVSRIVLNDTGTSQSQGVTLGGSASFNLANGFDCFGIETVKIDQAVNAGTLAPTFSVNSALSIHLNSAITTSGGGIVLSATEGIYLNNVLSTNGGNLSIEADADANGTGNLVVSSIVMYDWTVGSKLTADDGAAGDNFGEYAAISDDGLTAIVSTRYDDIGSNSDQGSAYVFVRSDVGWIQQAKLVASDGSASDWYGCSVAISSDGKTAIIGSEGDDIDAKANQGSAYVFANVNGVWTQQAKLIAADGLAGDFFGTSLSLSSDGNTALIGARWDDFGANTDQGSSYVFVRSGINWGFETKLSATDGIGGDNFGVSVALSSDGNIAIIGAYAYSTGSNARPGSAYTFTRIGSAWSQQTKLTAADGAGGNLFGFRVAISGDGDTAIIGAHFDDSRRGSAYVFSQTDATWTQQKKLIAPDNSLDDWFGHRVALSNDGRIAIVGATYKFHGSNGERGVSYVFNNANNDWILEAKLTAPTGSINGILGWCLAISGDGATAIIGAVADNIGGNSGQGSVLTYTRSSPDSGGQIRAGNGVIQISAADVDLRGEVSSNNSVKIGPSQFGRPVTLGPNIPVALSLRDSEIDLINTGNLQIGTTTSGSLTINESINRTNSTMASLVSGGDIVISGGFFDTAGGSLSLSPDSKGSLKPIKAGVDLFTGSTSLVNGGQITVTINGPTPDTQHNQLRVDGTLYLTGTNLVLAGTFTFGPNDLLSIVIASKRIGFFNNLPEGGTVLFGSQTLQINYTETGATLKLKTNSPPTITNLGGVVSYRENVVVARLCNAVRINDIDTPVFNNGTLRVAIESGGEFPDRLWLMNSQYLTVTGNELQFNGLVVGTFSGGTNSQPLQVTFNNRASINRVQHVLRCVCFAHDSDNPTATQRTVSIQVNDGAGGQVAATKRVNVIPVNDRPMLSGIPASSTYTLNATSVLVAPNAIVTDPDNANFAGGQLNVRYFGGQDASNRLLAGGFFSFDAANNLLRNGTIVGQRNASGGIGENNLVVTFNASATKAVVQEFMRSLSFQTIGGTSKASRYLEFSLTDGLGGTSNLVTTRIDVS